MQRRTSCHIVRLDLPPALPPLQALGKCRWYRCPRSGTGGDGQKLPSSSVSASSEACCTCGSAMRWYSPCSPAVSRAVFEPFRPGLPIDSVRGNTGKPKNERDSKT